MDKTSIKASSEQRLKTIRIRLKTSFALIVNFSIATEESSDKTNIA